MLQICFTDAIARVFTTEETIISYLVDNLRLYTLCVFFMLATPALNTLYRVTGKQHFMFWVNAVYFPLAIAVLSFFLCFVTGFGILGINLGYIVCKIIVCSALAWNLYYQVDWTQSKCTDEDDCEIFKYLAAESSKTEHSMIDLELIEKESRLL